MQPDPGDDAIAESAELHQTSNQIKPPKCCQEECCLMALMLYMCSKDILSYLSFRHAKILHTVVVSIPPKHSSFAVPQLIKRTLTQLVILQMINYCGFQTSMNQLIGSWNAISLLTAVGKVILWLDSVTTEAWLRAEVVFVQSLKPSLRIAVKLAASTSQTCCSRYATWLTLKYSPLARHLLPRCSPSKPLLLQP